MEDQHLISKT